MQIRCSSCTKTIAIAATGALPRACPHCEGACVPGQLGPFVPVRLIATGGMGEVYLARHAELGTEVAIKLLPAMPHDALAAVRERFAREARLTARVTHPGVVKVLACDVAAERPYLVLELVAGRTFRQRLGDGPLPIAEAARLAAATADVLAAAHQEGVLHRDVKPDNVMVAADGAVRVLDFGIARALGEDAPLTRTGEILGTPEYMAPEQLLFGPEATDERTDVHALGVLLYELLTGRSPFRGSNLFQTLKLVESLVPPVPSSLRPEVPAALDTVVATALQQAGAARQPSARAFAAAVRAAVPDALPMAPARRRPWFALPVLATLLVLPWLVVWSQRQPTTPPPPSSASPRRTADDLRALAAAGQWCDALAAATPGDLTDLGAARDVAREAFVCTHTIWPLLAGAPAWLGATDERLRARLFGDRLEPGDLDPMDDAAPWLAAQRALLAGEHTAERLASLREHAGAATLLPLADLPPAERAEALVAFAQRLPLASAEHWLALTIARHLQGDHAGGTQAAEMAWLTGAGELAVLLDAALQVLGPSTALQLVPVRTALTLDRRLRAADANDTPASSLLALLVAATQQPRDFDLGPARTFPAPWRAAAGRWFAAAALASPNARANLRAAATALGAAADDTEPPRGH